MEEHDDKLKKQYIGFYGCPLHNELFAVQVTKANEKADPCDDDGCDYGPTAPRALMDLDKGEWVIHPDVHNDFPKIAYEIAMPFVLKAGGRNGNSRYKEVNLTSEAKNSLENLIRNLPS